jgi:hypothetical protein
MLVRETSWKIMDRQLWCTYSWKGNCVAGKLIWHSLFISRNGSCITKITCYDPDNWILAWYPDFYNIYKSGVTHNLFYLYFMNVISLNVNIQMPGQSCYMLQLEVTNEDGANNGENRKHLKNNLLQWHFLHHSSHMKPPLNRPELCHGVCVCVCVCVCQFISHITGLMNIKKHKYTESLCFWTLSIVGCSKMQKTAFQKLDLFPSLYDGREIPALLGPWKELTSITGQPMSI